MIPVNPRPPIVEKNNELSFISSQKIIPLSDRCSSIFFIKLPKSIPKKKAA